MRRSARIGLASSNATMATPADEAHNGSDKQGNQDADEKDLGNKDAKPTEKKDE
jgi:hypothetical protein